MCESPIASSFNDLISPKLFYVFENTTDTVGIATVLVYGLACKDLLYPAKSAQAQHFWPWVPCHRVHFACGQSRFLCLPRAKPVWRVQASAAGRHRHHPPLAKPPQHITGAPPALGRVGWPPQSSISSTSMSSQSSESLREAAWALRNVQNAPDSCRAGENGLERDSCCYLG